MEKNKIKISHIVNSQVEKIKTFIENTKHIKDECEEFERNKKFNEEEIENVLKKMSNMNHKLEKLINNYKYYKS